MTEEQVSDLTEMFRLLGEPSRLRIVLARASSPPTRSWIPNTAVCAAASSNANGRPSSRRHSSATAGRASSGMSAILRARSSRTDCRFAG